MLSDNLSNNTKIVKKDHPGMADLHGIDDLMKTMNFQPNTGGVFSKANSKWKFMGDYNDLKDKQTAMLQSYMKLVQKQEQESSSSVVAAQTQAEKQPKEENAGVFDHRRIP